MTAPTDMRQTPAGTGRQRWGTTRRYRAHEPVSFIDEAKAAWEGPTEQRRAAHGLATTDDGWVTVKDSKTQHVGVTGAPSSAAPQTHSTLDPPAKIHGDQASETTKAQSPERRYRLAGPIMRPSSGMKRVQELYIFPLRAPHDLRPALCARTNVTARTNVATLT